MATLCINLVNFGSVTPEFKHGKDVHPVVFFFQINVSDKFSQNPVTEFLLNFHRLVAI